MFDNQESLQPIIYTVIELLKADNSHDLHNLIKNAQVTAEQTGYDNWNGGIDFYTIYLTIDLVSFVKIRDKISSIESALLEKFALAIRHIDYIAISKITIIPKVKAKIEWARIFGLATKEQLIIDVNFLKNIMISVSTGGQRIQDVNEEYIEKYKHVNLLLTKLNVNNPNPFNELWSWYAKWSSTFSKYLERRSYINEMYNSLLQILEEDVEPELISVTVDLSEWERIERSINEIQIRKNEALTEEQFQVVGLLCRETIISLAQAVFKKEKHPIVDGKVVSKTDAKRMLEAYIAIELGGASNETLRKYTRATLDLANELTHKRTATKRDASICATSTISIINIIGTIEGRI